MKTCSVCLQNFDVVERYHEDRCDNCLNQLSYYQEQLIKALNRIHDDLANLAELKIDTEGI